MKQKNEQKLRQAYSRGISRLCPEPALRERILDVLHKQQEKGGKRRIWKWAPALCACVCVGCLIMMLSSLLPLLQQSLAAKAPGEADPAVSSSKEDNSSVNGVFIITIQEDNGRVCGSIEWDLPESSQDDASPGLKTKTSTSLPLGKLQTKLLKSAYSGILFIDTGALSAQESLQEIALFLTSLEDSNRFTILTTLQNQGGESPEKEKAWAQAALIPYVKGAETILLESNSPQVTIYPLLQEMYPLSNSFGLPNEDGLLHTGVDYSVPKGETLFSPLDGTVVYVEKGCAVICQGNIYAAFSGAETLFLEEGQEVSAGEVVGTTAEGTLHLSILSDGRFLDPILCLSQSESALYEAGQ